MARIFYFFFLDQFFVLVSWRCGAGWVIIDLLQIGDFGSEFAWNRGKKMAISYGKLRLRRQTFVRLTGLTPVEFAEVVSRVRRCGG
jgi:hypothetical protein